jgi:hypothetical protein
MEDNYPNVELDNNIKKRFSKDFRLPINIFSEPYFSYFTELYNPVFKVNEKLDWLKQALSKQENNEGFFALSAKIASDIKKDISATHAYQTFNSADMNKDFPLIEQIKQQNIYIVPNIGKNLISIDLEKANFNCLNLFGLHEELGVKNYQELMLKYTDEPYFLNSKMIRQVIFGDLNPSRQQRVQKYIINNLCSELKKAGCELSSASSDEIIVQGDKSITEIKEILANVDEKFRFFRVEQFIFDRIGEEHDFFAKTTINDKGEQKLEFKNVPGHIFAQVYKKHFSLELNDYDMLFYHEGYLAQFKQAVFEPELELAQKNRMKMK